MYYQRDKWVLLGNHPDSAARAFVVLFPKALKLEADVNLLFSVTSSCSKTLDDVRAKLENFDQRIGVQIIQNALKVGTGNIVRIALPLIWCSLACLPLTSIRHIHICSYNKIYIDNCFSSFPPSRCL